MSVDPVTTDSNTGASFNRYWYANNNPYKLTDPDGRVAVCAIPLDPMQACMAVAAKVVNVVGLIATAAYASYKGNPLLNENAEAQSDQPSEGETSPCDGPGDAPVIVVDPEGNAIPVETGEQIRSSPDGEYQQVEGSSGEPTGTRLGRGGH